MVKWLTETAVKAYQSFCSCAEVCPSWSVWKTTLQRQDSCGVVCHAAGCFPGLQSLFNNTTPLSDLLESVWLERGFGPGKNPLRSPQKNHPVRGFVRLKYGHDLQLTGRLLALHTSAPVCKMLKFTLQPFATMTASSLYFIPLITRLHTKDIHQFI